MVSLSFLPVKQGYYLTSLTGKRDIKWYVWQPISNIRLPMILTSWYPCPCGVSSHSEWRPVYMTNRIQWYMTSKISHCNIHHLLLYHSFWRELAARHSNSPMEKPMWEVPEASQQETCEEAILEVDPPASGKPSEDGYPSWRLTPTSWKTLSQNHPAKPLLNFWLTETVRVNKYLLF